MTHKRSNLALFLMAVLGHGALGCSSSPPAANGGGGGSGGTGGATPAADGSAPDVVAGDAVAPPPDAGGLDVPLPSGARALTANDVSVLFPLTGATSPATLWRATLEGNGGPLLPLATYALVKRALIHGVQDYTSAEEHSLLRVVAVRFDPCFGATGCQAQVRLVLQALDSDGSVFDGAVHLLYNLTPAEFGALLGELRALTALAIENKVGLPLGPSPALMAQGVSGTYGTALRALVTRYAGAGTLARMTFMTREATRTPTWQFGGVNLKSFTPQGDLEIPGLPPNTRMQQVGGKIGIEYGYSLNPAPVKLSPLLAVTDADKAKTATPEVRAAAYQSLVSVENPTLENPDTADCASCHIANRLRGHMDQNYPPATPPAAVYSGLAQSTRFIGAAEKDADNLRAFGYAPILDIDSPVVSQRTANETHRVLQLLAAM